MAKEERLKMIEIREAVDEQIKRDNEQIRLLQKQSELIKEATDYLLSICYSINLFVRQDNSVKTHEVCYHGVGGILTRKK